MNSIKIYVGTLVVAGSSCVVAQESQEVQKNILCILVDDLGYGDLSCQGATDLLTPNIDRIGEKGIRFNNFYANCTVSSPSRASILTGKYPDMVGVPGVIRQNKKNSWGYLSEEAILLPQLLKEKNYQTAAIGKWHLGLEEENHPNERGFDYFKGFLGDMMDDYWTHLRGGINWMRYNKEVIDPKGHATDIFTDWSIEYMKEREKDKKPFYLYLAYNAPHFPIQPPQEYLDKVLAREKGLSEKRAKNVALIEHLDYSIGRIMDYLEESGLIENTLVVFTSDNGGSLYHAQSNGKLRGGKQDLYEGGIRVPAMACWKNKIRPGTVTDNVAMLMDLFPTFCEVAGVDIDHEIDGVSIVPTLFGSKVRTDNRYLFWMRREGGGYGGQAYYAARYRDYKLVQNTPFEAVQYFNIKEDEYETTPLKFEGNKDLEKLYKELQEHIRLSGSVPWQKLSKKHEDGNMK